MKATVSDYFAEKTNNNAICFKVNSLAAIGHRIRFYIYSSSVHDSINSRDAFLK